MKPIVTSSLAALAAGLILGGCAVAPVDGPYAYGYARPSAYYSYYDNGPVYYDTWPGYYPGYYYYGSPAISGSFSFGGDHHWKTDAARAFAWFLGSNDLSVVLVDTETGSCRDGLHPDRANENCGGESAVSYLLALAEIRQLARINVSPANPVALRAVGA